MSFAIKMVTYQEELKLLTEKINARKAKADAMAHAQARAQRNDAAKAKAEAKAKAVRKTDTNIDVLNDAKAKAKAKRIQMARIARLKLIAKQFERRKSEKKELDDFLWPKLKGRLSK